MSPRKSLQVIYPHSAGVDIGSKEIFVAVPASKEGASVRCFGTYTADLLALRDFLASHSITTVAMESTGIYWIPLYDLLSQGGLDVLLVNPSEVKQVPGRKSDVADCQWIQELHSLGLLRGGFRPSDGACEVRELMRQRQRLVSDAARQVQHMQKALLQMNLQLPQVVSDITGQTGLSIIEAILGGERNPETLARLRNGRCKQDEATIAKALQGTWRKEHLLSLRHAHELWAHYQRLREETEHALCESLEARFTDIERPPQDPPAISGSEKRKTSDFSEPVREVWERKTGVDLMQIEGVSAATASVLLGEVGLDIGRFKSAKHLASWAGLCPRHAISGGKVLRNKSGRSNRFGQALRLAVWGLKNSKGPMGSYYRSLVLRKGTPKAIVATAHKLLRIIYALLTQGADYSRAMLDTLSKNQLERKMNHLKRQAKAAGMQLVPMPVVS